MNQSRLWDRFLKNGSRWKAQFQQGRTRSVFDEIDSLLIECGIAFCFDITAEASVCCLIFSPEGDPVVAREVDLLVAGAPQIDGWNIYGRRRRKDLSDVAAILRNLYHIELTACRFDFRPAEANSIVEMHFPSKSALTREQQLGAIDTFLWHALGEDLVISKSISGRVAINESRFSAPALVKRVLEFIELQG